MLYYVSLSLLPPNQNPQDCSKARKLVCNINKGCGYGCQLHHVVYCFMIAYGTQRTLILESHNWRYATGGWETVFHPVSNSCTDRTGVSTGHWSGRQGARCRVSSQVFIVWPGSIATVEPLRYLHYGTMTSLSQPNPEDAGPIVRRPMGLPITAGCEPWTVVTPLALRCSASERCATREPLTITSILMTRCSHHYA